MLYTPYDDLVERFYEGSSYYIPAIDILAKLFVNHRDILAHMSVQHCTREDCSRCPLRWSEIGFYFACGVDCHDVCVAITNSGEKGYQSYGAYPKAAKMILDRIYELEIERAMRNANG